MKVTVELETALFDGQVRLRAAASHCAMKSVYRFGGMPKVFKINFWTCISNPSAHRDLH
jgi:hypothetical protein